MKSIKNIFLFTLATASLCFSSCSKVHEVETEFKTKSFGVYSALFSPFWERNYVSLNRENVVLDLSQGYLTHKWSFMTEVEPETDIKNGSWKEATESVRFIGDKHGAPGNDEDLAPYYDLSIPCVNSNESNVFVFTKAGRYKINIRNTYDESIRYYYSTPDDVTSNYIHYEHAKPTGDGDYYVEFDYEILVYGPLTGSAKAYTDAETTKELDLASLPKSTRGEVDVYDIPAGTTLYFLEGGSDTPYEGSSICDWFSSILDDSATEELVIEYEAKEEGSYKPSVAKVTFAKVGTYRFNMTRERLGHKSDIDDSKVGDPKTTTNVLGYYINVVE